MGNDETLAEEILLSALIFYGLPYGPDAAPYQIQRNYYVAYENKPHRGCGFGRRWLMVYE